MTTFARTRAVLMWCIISVSPALIASEPQPALTSLKFCHEDQNAYPWVFQMDGKNQGLDISLLSLVSQKINIPVEFISLPWKRCLLHLQNAKVHGAIGASFKAERLNMGRYPVTAKGNLDANRRIHTSSYSLYIPKQSKLGWNGETFINLDGPITIQSGFSIGDLIRKLGVQTVEFTNPKDNLKIVIEGRAAGAAMHTDRVDLILKNNPDLDANIKKYKVPIQTKPYYLMLSFELARNHPELTETIWNTLADVRESEEMANIRNAFYLGSLFE